MGLSGSEKSDGLSSSDSEYESKAANFKAESSKKKTPMKKRDETKKSKRVQSKKTAVKKEAMKIEPEEIKEEIKEISSASKSPKTSKSKKSLDNVLSDLIRYYFHPLNFQTWLFQCARKWSDTPKILRGRTGARQQANEKHAKAKNEDKSTCKKITKAQQAAKTRSRARAWERKGR